MSSLYKKIVDEAIECSPMEKLQERLDTQQNIIESLSGIVTKQVRV